jgi:hypothetical protein
MAKKQSEEVRLERVRQLFSAYAGGPRDETGVLLFYRWLEKYRRDLLPTAPGDPYEHLKMDLRGLYRD